MLTAPFKFDLGEKFPHLSNPPIVEAVLHWQARAGKTWNEGVRDELTRGLPAYEKQEPTYQLEFLAVGGGEQPPVAQHHHNWQGYRLTTTDQKYIAQMSRDGVVLSRMEPYQDWTEFEAEGRKVWGVFRAIAGPVEVQRLGVRFINRLRSASFD